MRSHEISEKYPECKRWDDNFMLWECFSENGKGYLFEIIGTINKEECHDLLKGNLKDYARYSLGDDVSLSNMKTGVNSQEYC